MFRDKRFMLLVFLFGDLKLTPILQKKTFLEKLLGVFEFPDTPQNF